MSGPIIDWCESCGRSLDRRLGDPTVCKLCRGERMLAERREQHARAEGALCVSDGDSDCCAVCGAFLPRAPACADCGRMERSRTCGMADGCEPLDEQQGVR